MYADVKDQLTDELALKIAQAAVESIGASWK